jgi:hypothetical protein
MGLAMSFNRNVPLCVHGLGAKATTIKQSGRTIGGTSGNICGFARAVWRSEDQHGIAVTVKAVPLRHGLLIGGEDVLAAREGHDEE